MVVAVKFVRCTTDTLINKFRFKTQQQKEKEKRQDKKEQRHINGGGEKKKSEYNFSELSV